MLLKAGVIHEFQLNSALSFQRQLGGRLGASLIRLGYLDEDTLLSFLAEQMDLSRIDLDAAQIPDDVIRLVPVEKALEFSIIPFGFKKINDARTLFIAMSDPTSLTAIDDLKFATGYRIRASVASEDSIIRAIKKYYDIDAPKRSADSPTSTASQPPSPSATRKNTISTEEKFKILLKILVEKNILDKQDLDRFKG